MQAHIEAVHADWKEYLNLLICEESHLKFMEDFHKVPHPWGQRVVGARRAVAGLQEILEYKNSCCSGNWVEEVLKPGLECSKPRIFKARRAP